MNIVHSTINTPAIRPFDARDLDGNGAVNADDGTILESLRTRSRCTTR
jgi:hypothetical protein